MTDVKVTITTDLDKRGIAATSSAFRRMETDAKTSFQNIATRATVLTGAVSGLAAALSAAIGAKFIRQGIDAADRMDELSKRLSTTTEQLSTLKFAVGQAGASFEGLVGGLTRAQVALGKAGIGGQDLIKTLGVISDEIRATNDPFERAAKLAKTFGRSAGPELKEFMSLGSAGIRELTDRARALGLELSTGAAEAAGKFNDQMESMRLQIERAKIELATGFMQAFGAFKGEIMNPALLASIRELGEALGTAFRFLVDNAGTIMQVLGALAGAAAGGVIGGPAGALVGGALGGGLTGLAGTVLSTQRDSLAAGRIQGLPQDAAQTDEALRRQVSNFLQVGAAAKEADSSVAGLADSLREATHTTDAFGEAQEAFFLATDAAKLSREEFTESVRMSTQAIEHELSILGMSDEQSARLTTRFELLNQAKERGIVVTEELSRSIDAQAQAEGALITAREQIESARRAAEETQRIWQSMAEQLSQSLTDSIFRGFENGKTFAQNFADSMVNLFKTLATRLLQGVILQAVGGLFSTAASALGGILGGGPRGGAGANLLGGAASLSSLFGGPGLFSGVGGGINNLGLSLGFGLGRSFVGPLPAGGGALTSASLSSILGFGGAGAFGGGLLASALGGNPLVGSIAGGIGGIGGGLAGGALGGAAAGSVVPVIGTAIGAILGGLLGGAFKPTPPRGAQISGLAGTISQSGKKGFDPRGLNPLSSQIRDTILAFDRELGLNLVKDRIKFWIGFKEGRGFRTTVSGPGDVGKRDVDFQDANRLVATIIRQELRGPVGARGGIIGRRALAQPTAAAMLRSLQRDIQIQRDITAFTDVREPGSAVEETIRQLRSELRQLTRERNRLLRGARQIGAPRRPILEAFETRREDIVERRRLLRQSVLEAAFQAAGEPIPLAMQIKAVRLQFDELEAAFKKLGLSTKILADLEKKAIDKLRPSVDKLRPSVDKIEQSRGFIGFLTPRGQIVEAQTEERFAQLGLNKKIFSSPTLLNVAETGPEEVTVRPPGSAARQSAVRIELNGPAIFNDLTMDKFVRSVDRAIRSRSLRFG